MRILMVIVLLTLVVLVQAADRPQRILVVVTSNGTMGETDKPTGYWLAEVAHPWLRFVDAGYIVDVASPTGGKAPMDPRSRDLEDPENRRFWEELNGKTTLAATMALAEVDPDDYAAIFFAGGHGTMWDFPGNLVIQGLVHKLIQNDGVIAAVCHGPAALVDVALADGSQLVAGRRVTAFSNSEEQAIDLQDVVPFLLADRLREQGAKVEVAADWQPNVVVDGRLVTGQNPASAGPTADAVLELLAPR